ncbi:probable inactive histone-lysine N-methyltransferase SUVR1 isoform X2 [Andrographis paniculata]|uniref:probable inactive histone-lysine N-methyltransferase SUVR1 isoform X2 n=1 Tax=Andrographis paniculata TaxID=175694 RepID=UPI0021E96DAA|nr:probable inactive histone-lysine N-methyltransferase SUVR1 isoform X2 [Andrographis paniculata]
MSKETKAKVANAFRAMKAIGISENKVKPVLKTLLKLYDKNWALIEEENYRALADAIFEKEESEAAEQSKKISKTQIENFVNEEDHAAEESEERPLKRLRHRHRDGQPSSSHMSGNGTVKTPLVRPKEEPEEIAIMPTNGSASTGKRPHTREENTTINSQSVTPPSLSRDKGKQLASAEPSSINERDGRPQPSSISRNQQKTRLETEPRSPSHPMKLRDRRHGATSPQPAPKEKRPVPDGSSHSLCLKEPKIEPDILPHHDVSRGDSLIGHEMLRENYTPEPSAVQSFHEKEIADGTTAPNQSKNNTELPEIPAEHSSTIEIASSSKGEARMYLKANLDATGSNFHIPSLESVVKHVEDKCFRSSKSLDPNISLMNVMKEVCECFVELGTNSKSQSPKIMDIAPTTDPASKCSAPDGEVTGSMCMRSWNNLADSQSSAKLTEYQISLLPYSGMIDEAQPITNPGDEIMIDREDKESCAQATDGLSLEVGCQSPAPCNNMDDEEQEANTVAGGEMAKNGENQENFDDECMGVAQQSLPDSGVHDIAKGQEKVVITMVNEVNDESPPSFFYIPQNTPFQNAYVNFFLARIGDKNCCPTCSVDCLSSPTPCACANETGGEFAYTSDGLVKEEFLKECISMNRDSKKHCQYYCKVCPLERSKCVDAIEPCKGHLVRKFIKECWWKCGCTMECGNRVVQRGITHKLQVFMTPGGKGWGLRTLEDLPKGTFVCEYVGEVLTNAELFDRVQKRSRREKHSYPVLLDADWCAEAVLKDEEALCLDATYYGNVARFINHRCYDSNLVEIPVEVETPDHHYYHLAFFTTRKIRAMEELTWDYGIDFDDHDHPIKAFRCQCGSKFCRNIKRTRPATRSSSRRY